MMMYDEIKIQPANKNLRSPVTKQIYGHITVKEDIFNKILYVCDISFNDIPPADPKYREELYRVIGSIFGFAEKAGYEKVYYNNHIINVKKGDDNK